MRNPFKQQRAIDDAVQAYASALADGGRDALTVANTSAAQIAAREFGSALASTRSNHPALTPTLLNNIGRDLALQGHALLLVNVTASGVALQRPASWDVSGNSPDPRKWRYQCTVSGPTDTTEVVRTGASVAHLRYYARAGTPWRGVSPLESDAGTALANLELRLRQEFNTPTGYALPVPESPREDGDDPDDAMQALADDLRALAGGLFVVESMASGWQEGRVNAPSGEWQPRRFGASPPEGLIRAHGQLVELVLAQCGVPPILATASADNSAIREGRRSFLSATVLPLVGQLEDVLSEALDFAVELDLTHLLQGDLQARSRAVGTLVSAGVDVERAMRLSGFTEEANGNG